MKQERAKYHFQPRKGWINDPNGLCWFQGKYHAFAQHYPHAPKWGPMHWLHATSEDLIHWEELPIALYPDQDYEQEENGGGCFSGSAMEKDGILYLMYTSVSTEHGQTQSIVTTKDGVHFEKYPGNPVIPQSPVDPSNRDFRDPKVFEYEGSYRMVCGAGVGEMGYVLLYSSEDLIHWDYLGKIYESDEYKGTLECPDFFPCGDRWVLAFSRMDNQTVQYVVGDFDGTVFTPDFLARPEVGTDFYAAQSFEDPKGRRIVMAWIHDWDAVAAPETEFMGSLTIPREITLKNEVLYMVPVEEAKALLQTEDDCVVRENGKLLIKNGDKILYSCPEEDVRDVEILADADLREVFLNEGQINCSFVKNV